MFALDGCKCRFELKTIFGARTGSIVCSIEDSIWMTILLTCRRVIPGDILERKCSNVGYKTHTRESRKVSEYLQSDVYQIIVYFVLELFTPHQSLDENAWFMTSNHLYQISRQVLSADLSD